MPADRSPRLRALAACFAVALGLGPALARSQQPGDDEVQLEARRAEILKMIGEAPCVNLVHCRLLALGTRPCGGPDEYLAYSSHTADRVTLENKALDYALQQEDIQRAGGVVGICVVVPEPQVACVQGRCRVVSEP